MTTTNKYFSKHFFRNVFLCLLGFFIFCFFVYKNETFLQASIAQCFIEELPDDYLEISDWYLEDGKPESAIKVLQKACKADPDNRGEYLAEMGDIYIEELTDYETAIEVLEESCKIKPDEYDYLSLSRAYKESGMVNEAIETIGKARKINPKDEHYYLFDEGIIYYKFGFLNEAELCIQEVVRLKPHWSDARVFLGKIQNELGKKDEAMQQYENLKTQNEEQAAELWELISQ